MSTTVKIAAHGVGDIFDALERNDKLFGTVTTDEGRVLLGLRKVRGSVYENEKGIGVLLDPDDIRHLLNVLRMARADARKVKWEKDNECRS